MTSFYIHFPICQKKCSYCDFVSFPCGDVLDEMFLVGDDLLAYYLKEIELYYNLLGRCKISSVYFGGGTPSLMSASMLFSILSSIKERFELSEDVEITLEVNPKTVDEKKICEFREAGVNRLSIGIQSLNDEELKFLGRVHNSFEAMETIQLAKQYFDNVSLDFIYALPNQTLESWRNDLEQIVALGATHLSLYQLIFEEGTPFYQMLERGDVNVLDEDSAFEMFKFTNSYLKYTYPQYEVSNYAKKQFYSQHNLNYWNGGDYIGIGVSAAGRISVAGKKYMVENPRTIDDWKIMCEMGKLPLQDISNFERGQELIIMGLRKNNGINLKGFEQVAGVKFFDIVSEERFETLLKGKFILMKNDIVKLSFKGRNVLDAILRELLV